MGFRAGSSPLGTGDYKAPPASGQATPRGGIGGRYSGHPADLLLDRSCGQRPVKPFSCLLAIIWADSNPVFATCYARCATWMTTAQASLSLYTGPRRASAMASQVRETPGHSST